jgi:hypothetical protein
MAEIGNTNAVRHGSRSKRSGVVLAALADRHAAIAVDLRRLKRTLDPYVQHRQGADRLKAVAMVNEICRWEMSARVMQKTMATESLSPELMLTYLNSIGNATRNRNAMITKLVGDGKGSDGIADPWLALLDTPQAAVRDQTLPDVPEAVQGQESASDDAPERQEGNEQ